jgi:hypothetical protein
MTEDSEHNAEKPMVDVYDYGPVANDVPSARYVPIWVPEEFVRGLADVAEPRQGLAVDFWVGIAIGMCLGSPLVGALLYWTWR